MIRAPRRPRLAAAFGLIARAARPGAPPAPRRPDAVAAAAGEAAPAPTLDLSPAPAAGGRGGRIALVSFVATVLLPALAIAAYYLFIAADQFEASARFTVREVRAPPILGAAEAGGGLGGGFAAAAPSSFNHVVASYVRSRAGLEDLAAEIDVAALYRRPEADFLARLPEGASAEDRLEHWRERVSATVDGPSGVVTLRVRAFRPEDAVLLAEGLLRRSEALVNDLSARQKDDALAGARADAAAAEARLRAAIGALAALRAAEGLVDPALEAGATLGLLTGLIGQRIEIDGAIAAASGAMRADTARMRALEERRAAVEAEIAALRAGLAGAGDAAIAAAFARFETAAAERRFAERLHEIAQRRLIEAEIDRARQSVYLGVYDPPRAAEDSRYPRRIAFPILAFLGLFTLWAIAALVWAAVEDHRMA
jgi:capsular polysaccharide transport system permease protein